MNITYKKLTVNDLDVFIKMRINQLREEGAKEDIDLEPALKDYYLRHLSDGEKPPYFGCPSGKIGLLSSMFTDPSYRRKGIAKTLLSKVIDEAKTQGCGTVQITASNMGVLLYSDYGFEKNENFMQFKL